MKKKLLCITVVSMLIGMGMLTSCSVNDNPGKEDVAQKADLVVYGKIFTAEGNQVVEAFAVKDGKYVYVGDKAGAAAFVEEGKTEVVDYTGKGLVMPGCGNGHAHYTQAYAMAQIGTQISSLLTRMC
jgi:predicted amidohydrolase YtcJ